MEIAKFDDIKNDDCLTIGILFDLSIHNLFNNIAAKDVMMAVPSHKTQFKIFDKYSFYDYI